MCVCRGAALNHLFCTLLKFFFANNNNNNDRNKFNTHNLSAAHSKYVTQIQYTYTGHAYNYNTHSANSKSMQNPWSFAWIYDLLACSVINYFTLFWIAVYVYFLCDFFSLVSASISFPPDKLKIIIYMRKKSIFVVWCCFYLVVCARAFAVFKIDKYYEITSAYRWIQINK